MTEVTKRGMIERLKDLVPGRAGELTIVATELSKALSDTEYPGAGFHTVAGHLHDLAPVVVVKSARHADGTPIANGYDISSSTVFTLTIA